MTPIARWYARQEGHIAHAAAETVAGLVAAIVVSSLVFVLGAGTFGSDWTQRLLLASGSPGGAAGIAPARSVAQMAPGHRQIPRSWVFVDLNGPFCRSGSLHPRCTPDLVRTDRVALAKLIANVRAQRPRLIVLDVATPISDHSDSEMLQAEVARTDTAPLLLIWFGRRHGADGAPEDAMAQSGLFSMDNARPPVGARYLPSTVVLDGPAARSLTPTVHATFMSGVAWLPNAAFGAALVAMDPADRPFDRLDRFVRAGSDDGCRLLAGVACRDYRLVPRVFSFRPRQADDAEQLVQADHRLDFVRIAPDIGTPLPSSLRDAVVVIGNTDPEAGDVVWTAAGGASGAELILNDIRQFLLIGPTRPESWWDDLFQERWLIFGGCLIIFGTSLAIDNLVPVKGDGTANHEKALSARAFANKSVKLVLITIVTFMWGLACVWQRDVAKNSPPDMITPLLGIIAEKFIETMHQVLAALEAIVEYCILRRKADHSAAHSGES